MIAHPTTEILSAHLDGELTRWESSRVRRHLDECSRCCHELEGIRRTVGRLRELERSAPSDLLGTRVQRLVALEADDRTLGDRFELRRFRLPVQSSTLLTFALVFAFAVILYLFASALERQRSGTIPVDLGSSPTRVVAGEVDAPRAPVEEWVWDGTRWTEESGTGRSSPPRLEIRRGSPEWEELLRHHPELASLPHREEGVAVWLHEGERFLVLP